MKKLLIGLGVVALLVLAGKKGVDHLTARAHAQTLRERVSIMLEALRKGDNDSYQVAVCQWYEGTAACSGSALTFRQAADRFDLWVAAEALAKPTSFEVGEAIVEGEPDPLLGPRGHVSAVVDGRPLSFVVRPMVELTIER